MERRSFIKNLVKACVIGSIVPIALTSGRNFKDVEKNFNKGSISKADFKRQNNILKKQLNEITSRINNIRGIISSL